MHYIALMDGKSTPGLATAVGARVRDARTTHGLTLDQLAERSDVSRRMIVNVEAGSTNASIATLLRLARALDVSLADLVADPAADVAVTVTTAAEREPLWHGPNGGAAALVASARTPDMLELWEWTLKPGETYESEAHRHGTRELVHVRAGRLDLTVNEVVQQISPGDGASFVTDVPHAYGNSGEAPVVFTMTVFEPIPSVRP